MTSRHTSAPKKTLWKKTEMLVRTTSRLLRMTAPASGPSAVPGPPNRVMTIAWIVKSTLNTAGGSMNVNQ